MRNFNRLSAAQTELLALLAEECGECVQVIGKILRHGYYSTNPTIDNSPQNYEMLEKEMGDVRAAMTLLCDQGTISKSQVQRHTDKKLETVFRWMHHNNPDGTTIFDGLGGSSVRKEEE